MKRVIFAIGLLLLISLNSCSIKPINIEQIVTVLSSHQYYGRLVGTEGNDRAANYIADVFKESNIDAYFDGYFQNYSQKSINPTNQNTTVTIVYANGTEEPLTYGSEFITDAVADDINLDLPLSFNVIKSKPDEIIPILPLEILKEQPSGSKAIVISRDAFRYAPSIPQHGDPLKIYISTNLRERFQKAGAVRAKIKANSSIRDITAKNVVAMIKSGKGSKKAIVLTAHFDHVGSQGSVLFPGALDNASGTAVLLSTAVKLKNKLGNKLPDADIIFACVNSEECSSHQVMFAGSKALVEELSKSYSDILNINLDCIGGKKAGPLALGSLSRKTTSVAKALQEVFKQYGLEYVDEEYEAGSDHLSFLEKGYAAVVVGQKDIAGVTHNEVDKADTVDYTVLEKVSSAVSDFIQKQGLQAFDLIYKDNASTYFDSSDWWKDAYAEKRKAIERQASGL